MIKSKREIIKELINPQGKDITLLFPKARCYNANFMYKFCLLVRKLYKERYIELALYLKWDFINVDPKIIKKASSPENYQKILNNTNWEKPNLIVRKFLDLLYRRNIKLSELEKKQLELTAKKEIRHLKTIEIAELKKNNKDISHILQEMIPLGDEIKILYEEIKRLETDSK
jgi:hypothetical protein